MQLTPNNYADFKLVAATAGSLTGVFYSASQLWAYQVSTELVILLTGATAGLPITTDFPAAIALTDVVAFIA